MEKSDLDREFELFERLSKLEEQLKIHLNHSDEKFKFLFIKSETMSKQFIEVERWLASYSKERKFLIWFVGASCGAVGMKIFDVVFLFS